MTILYCLRLTWCVNGHIESEKMMKLWWCKKVCVLGKCVYVDDVWATAAQILSIKTRSNRKTVVKKKKKKGRGSGERDCVCQKGNREEEEEYIFSKRKE